MNCTDAPASPAVLLFRRENIKHIWPELIPLVEQHWGEVSHYRDIAFDPDFNFYLKADEAGMLRVYAAREDGVLIGYNVFFVRPNPHVRTRIYAAQDAVFIRKDRRGRFGIRFIDWCDQELKREGVTVIMGHVSAAHDFGPALERHLGYELVDHIYCRRMDK